MTARRALSVHNHHRETSFTHHDHDLTFNDHAAAISAAEPDLGALREMSERQQRFRADKTWQEFLAWMNDIQNRWASAYLQEAVLLRSGAPDAERLAAAADREAIEQEGEDAGFEEVRSIELVELTSLDDGEEIPF